jgi:hypothetical protein
MKTLFLIFITIILTSCAAQSPAIVAGKGAVFGTLKAQSHSQFIEKVAKKGNGHEYNELVFDDTMVNYPNLKELYAGIIYPSYTGGETHDVLAQTNGMFPRSIAISQGDKLSISNSTENVLSFFLADAKDKFQDLSKVNPGETRTFTVEIQGNLELITDENENLKTFILSKKGLKAQKLKSGDYYKFEKLDPGSYQMVFWFWRLGKIVRKIQVRSGQNIELNELLSVNSVIP